MPMVLVWQRLKGNVDAHSAQRKMVAVATAIQREYVSRCTLFITVQASKFIALKRVLTNRTFSYIIPSSTRKY